MKKRVLLLHPPTSLEDRYGKSAGYGGHIHPPQGICHLAAMIRDKYDVLIIDAMATGQIASEVVDEIIAWKPDVIGVMSFTVSFEKAVEMMEGIKIQLPNCFFVLGGPHISAVPVESMKCGLVFDVGVIGEGEFTLVELLEVWELGDSFEGINGLIFRKDGELVVNDKRALIQDLDTLPFPAWDLLPHIPDFYRPSEMTYLKLPAVSLVCSRGCPYSCAYCDMSVFGRKWRAFSPERMVEFISHLYHTYGILDFNIQDDNFLVNKRKVIAFSQVLMESKLPVIWSTVGRADAMEPTMASWMAKSGCWQVAFGLETANDHILKVLGKGETVAEMERGIRVSHEAGITVKGLFMAGNPLETIDTLEKTDSWIKEQKIEYVSMSAFTPLPNTRSWEFAEEYGTFEERDWSGINMWDPKFVPHGLTKEIIQKYIRRSATVHGKKKKHLPLAPR